jgi:hypothetical protein
MTIEYVHPTAAGRVDAPPSLRSRRRHCRRARGPKAGLADRLLVVIWEPEPSLSTPHATCRKVGDEMRRLRSPAAALAVGALLGLVVAGGGSRAAMRVIALADDREDFGLPTEGGDIVGEVTLEGTLVVLFTGVVLGIVGAFAYLALRRWLPERPLLRTLFFALIILGLGLTATINGNEADFEFVNTVVSILGFACVLLVYGMLVPTLLDRLAPRTASASAWGRALAAAVLVVALVSGALAVRHAFEIADDALLRG